MSIQALWSPNPASAYRDLARSGQDPEEWKTFVDSVLAQKGAIVGKYGYSGNPTGTGENFLSGLGYLGRSFNDPGPLLDPSAGGLFDYTGPFAIAKFLQGEFAPGGYLSSGAQSIRTAKGVRQISESGRFGRQQLMDRLGASGLNASYAARAASGYDRDVMRQVNSFTGEQMEDQSARRFEAMQAFLNMVNQTAIAGKTAKANYDATIKGARAAESGGRFAGLSNIIGGAISTIPFI